MKDCRQTAINLILFLLCAVAIGFSIARVVPCEITTETYIGILVTLLGVIVTVAIGYQIYNIVEFRDNLGKTMTKIDNTKKEVDETKTKVDDTRDKVDETKTTIDTTKKEVDETKDKIEALKAEVDSLQAKINYVYEKNEALSQSVLFSSTGYSQFNNNQNYSMWIVNFMRAIDLGLKCNTPFTEYWIRFLLENIDKCNDNQLRFSRKEIDCLQQSIVNTCDEKKDLRIKQQIDEVMTKLYQKLDKIETT